MTDFGNSKSREKFKVSGWRRVIFASYKVLATYEFCPATD
jgi:hypothetical protein